MSRRQPGTSSQRTELDSGSDDSSSSDAWLGGETDEIPDFGDALRDALEIDDDDPQPEYGDFWYERELIE